MDKMPSFEELNKVEKEKIEELEIPEVKPDDISEGKLEQESDGIKNELEKMPAEEREKIGVGLRNFGFFAKELKSQAMAWIFENAGGDKKEAQEAEGFTGSIKRWAQGWAQSYRKDETIARKNIEQTKELDLSLKQVGNVGFITGETMKYGRTVADVIGWTAGSPLRYVMFGAQIFSRGAEAAKEARLMNTKVIDKTRIQDMNEAAEEAWKIYENAQTKAEEKGEKVSKQNLEKSYVENLPEDLLKRLEKSEPGMATGILQRVLKKDLEFAIQHGKIKIGEDGKVEKLFENSFNDRLKEYDRLISQYGAVDALAMGAKYAETAGKAVVAVVSIETAYLGVKSLIHNLPKIVNTLMEIGVSEAQAEELSPVLMAKTEFKLPEKEPPHFEELGKLKIVSEPETEIKTPIIEAIEVKDSSLENEKLMELATIKKGEGIEHALIRQLKELSPEKMKEFGFKGNADNATDVKNWINNKAHDIAIKSGYVDINTGEEIRIGTEGRDKAAYVLEKQGNEIKIKEYFKGEKDFDLKEEHIAAKDYKSAKFEGVEKESYEYIEKPKVKLTPEKMAEMADKGSKEYIEESSKKYPEQEIDRAIKNLAEETFKTPTSKFSAENAQNVLKTLDSTERANVGKMTIGKLLAETTADKIDKVQVYGSTEGIVDLPPARAQLSEVEYRKYVQLSEQVRGTKLSSQEMGMTVDEFLQSRNPKAQLEPKIDEHYNKIIAEQERLKGIERAEMREKSEYYDEKYNEQERLKGIEIQKASELKTFAADLVKEYPKEVKVNINDDALLTMKERGINFQKGKLTNIIRDKGKGDISFEPIGKQITQKIDISKEGVNLLVKVTDTDGTIQKLYITDQNRLGIVKEDFEAYKKLAETAVAEEAVTEKKSVTEISSEKPIEKPEAKPEIKSEIPEAKATEEQPKIDQSWSKGLRSEEERVGILTDKFLSPDIFFEDRINALKELTKDGSIKINEIQYWQKDGKLYSDIFGEITKENFSNVFRVK